MQYSITEENTGRFDWKTVMKYAIGDFDCKDVRLMRPTSSFEKMRRNLDELASRSVKLRKFTVYYDKLPTIFVECCRGVITYERFAGYFLGYYKREFGEEKEEREYCQEHEARRKIRKGTSYGRNNADLSSWILKAPESTIVVVPKKKKVYVPKAKKFNIRRRNGKEIRIKAKRRRKG